MAMLKEGERKLIVVAVELGSCGIVTQHCPTLLGSSVAASAWFFLQHGIVFMSDICVSGMSMPAIFPGMVSMFGIISMPDIVQTCSALSRAVPANTLPPTASTRTRDENRFSIAK